MPCLPVVVFQNFLTLSAGSPGVKFQIASFPGQVLTAGEHPVEESPGNRAEVSFFDHQVKVAGGRSWIEPPFDGRGQAVSVQIKIFFLVKLPVEVQVKGNDSQSFVRF